MSKLYRWTLEALPDDIAGSPQLVAQATGAPRMAASMIAAASAELAAELQDGLVAAGFPPPPSDPATQPRTRQSRLRKQQPTSADMPAAVESSSEPTTAPPLVHTNSGPNGPVASAPAVNPFNMSDPPF